MKKIDWKKGAPKEDGIFWFDPSDGIFDLGPFVVQVTKHETYLHGDFGGGPLKYYYHEKLFPKAKHARIELPTEETKWQDLTSKNYDKNTRCWVKTPDGYIGLGMLKPGWHGPGGTIVWLTHPTCASGSGSWITPDYKYMFTPVENPKQNKTKIKRKTKAKK